jgi:hypothetical protein
MKKISKEKFKQKIFLIKSLWGFINLVFQKHSIKYVLAHKVYVVLMVNLTLSIPAETKARMDRHKEIKWSRAIRNLIEQKLDDFEEAERLANKLDLSEKDLKPILDKINNNMAKHAEALLNESNNRC